MNTDTRQLLQNALRWIIGGTATRRHIMAHNVFVPARRETDRTDQFRRRWRRTGEATNFTEETR
jgi:hypothetical protein